MKNICAAVSLLMFDARSWARWIAAKRREETARCEREGRIRSLAEVNGQVREIKHWLVTGKGLCKSTRVLHRRQLFAPPMLFVTEDMSAAARHTGPHVQGRVVDRREMLRLVRNGLRASSDAIWLLLEDGKDGSAEG